MDYIQNLEFTLGGIKNPKIDIRGKKKENITLKLYVDKKEVELISNEALDYSYVLKKMGMGKNEEKIDYSIIVSQKIKLVELYVVKNKKEIKIKEIKTNLIKRIFEKIIYSIKRILYKLKRLPKIIFKVIKIMWTRHHFIVPPKMIKRYIKSFNNNINHNTVEELFYNPLINNEYNKWLDENKYAKEIKNLKYRPLISIVIPVYNVKREYLQECIDSVLNQTYDNFEICIADDCSTNEETVNTLKEYEKRDKRIKVVYRKTNGHISEATNSAIEIATGEFIGLLDNDDILDEYALYEVVSKLNENKDLDMIYTDEDKLNSNGEYSYPNFKPDWSPDTFNSSNYICHFTVLRKSIVNKIGGFRSEYNGSQDYDLFLRFTEQTNKICHIPRILYHWRVIEGSTAAAGSNKNYAYEAGKLALEDSFKRKGIKANVEQIGNPQMFYVNYLLDKEPLISIIIPTRDKINILDRCLDSIFNKTNYKNFEVIVVDNGSVEEETFKVFEQYKNKYKNFKVQREDCEFNYSYLNNAAIKKCKGEYIVLLNNDTEVIYPNWLTDMVGYAAQPHVGCVGAKLLYPDTTIQHSGVVIGCGGVASHAYVGTGREAFGYMGRLISPFNWAAVTAACLMIKKSKFEEVDGLDEKLRVAYNDVDLNLKILEKGYYNVILPKVELFHYESISRGSDFDPKNKVRFMSEFDYMISKWKENIITDKFYNQNFSHDIPFYLDKKKEN